MGCYEKCGTYYELLPEELDKLEAVATEKEHHIFIREGGVNKKFHICRFFDRHREASIFAAVGEFIVLLIYARSTDLLSK